MEKLRFQPDRVHGKDFLPRRQYQHPALTLEPGFPNGEVYFGTAEARKSRRNVRARSRFLACVPPPLCSVWYVYGPYF